MDINKPTTNKKLQQFISELNDLLARYQYKITPTASLSVTDVIPLAPGKEVIKEEKKGKQNA